LSRFSLSRSRRSSLLHFQMAPLKSSSLNPRDETQHADLDTLPDIEQASPSLRKGSIWNRFSGFFLKTDSHQDTNSDQDELFWRTDTDRDSIIVVEEISCPAPVSLKRPQSRRSSILDAVGSAINKIIKTRKDSSMCDTSALNSSTKARDVTTAGSQSIHGWRTEASAFEHAAVEGRLHLRPSFECPPDGPSSFWRQRLESEWAEESPNTPTPTTNADAGLAERDPYRWDSLRNWSPTPTQRRRQFRQLFFSRKSRQIAKGKRAAIPSQPCSSPPSDDGFTLVARPNPIFIRPDIPAIPKELGVLPCIDSESIRSSSKIPVATFRSTLDLPLKPLTRLHQDDPFQRTPRSDRQYSCSSSMIALRSGSPPRPPTPFSPVIEPVNEDSSASDTLWDISSPPGSEPFESSLISPREELPTFISSRDRDDEMPFPTPKRPDIVPRPLHIRSRPVSVPSPHRPRSHLDADAISTISQRTGFDYDLQDEEGLWLTRMNERTGDKLSDTIYFGDE
jgi:hypothetical protein